MTPRHLMPTHPRFSDRAGLSLLELLIAGTLGLVVILALSQTDVSRVRLGDRISEAVFRHADARSAIGHVVKRLEAADRVILLDASNAACQSSCVSVQLRIPPTDPTQLDTAASYQWVQYKRDATSNELRYYSPASSCAIALSFKDVTGFTLSYENQSPAPPGGEPMGVSDSNLVQVSLVATDPKTGDTTTFPASVTIRGAGYTNVSSGLSEAGPQPPAPCS